MDFLKLRRLLGSRPAPEPEEHHEEPEDRQPVRKRSHGFSREDLANAGSIRLNTIRNVSGSKMNAHNDLHKLTSKMINVLANHVEKHGTMDPEHAKMVEGLARKLTSVSKKAKRMAGYEQTNVKGATLARYSRTATFAKHKARPVSPNPLRGKVRSVRSDMRTDEV